MKFSDKSFFITGVTDGIGKSLVSILVKEKALVVGVARNGDKIKKLTAELGFPKNLMILKTDLKESGSIGEIKNFLEEKNIIPDIVILNAAVGYFESLKKTADEKIDEVVITNLLNNIKITKLLLKNGKSNFVFISSLVGQIGFANLSAYSATKGGIERFAEALREETNGSGVKVLVVRPGIVKTNFFTNAKMTDYGKISKGADPDKVAMQILGEIEKGTNGAVTLGSDKYYLFFKRFLSYKMGRKLLSLFG